MSFNTFLQAFANKLEERKIDVRVVDFIGTGWMGCNLVMLALIS
ncbi:MAG: hypothetical protein QXN40_08310 [Candidatus Bathyarchaeia archaeon]